MVYNLDAPVRATAFGNVVQKSGKWHSGRRIATNIVIYCTDGEMHMEVENELFHIFPGDLLIIPYNAYYKPLDGGRCRYYFFHFQAEELSYAEDAPNHIIICPHADFADGYAYTCVSKYQSVIKIQPQMHNAPYYVKKLFEQAENLKPNTSFFDQLRLDLLLREVLIYMSDTSFSKMSKHLTEIIKYIEQHYAENLSLSALSEHFSLSESYIARLFKKELSEKPSEYVNRIRISIAKTMLSQTTMSVTEIAEKVGYSDVYYFSKIFKKIVGCSPLKAR